MSNTIVVTKVDIYVKVLSTYYVCGLSLAWATTNVQKRLQRNVGIVEDMEFKKGFDISKWFCFDAQLRSENLGAIYVFCKLYCISTRCHKLPDG